ncbi:Protein of unknown function [Andreprevotia lacus DSM 23236]|uniref:DUF2867 domain-containing protein n=1 Tax=Andreprevotia lacus DSM 23236 TaxID=1121001 RepID=A0A1W1WXW3_9NEIS|nr:DUF2867 domain-containing protein [Andreprevotia lacus]SMC16447.1 Protein of unknown function [Andreprevotia lacus DSM 23236]
MQALRKVTRTFPSARIPSQAGGLPVEVSLIAQLGHGAGDQVYQGVTARQRQHAEYVDELDEPSARLGATDFAKGDATALYSFSVGPNGHPFHRHAGHRMFTAISGSGGAQLRFSTASPTQIAADPQAFFDALRFINIPPDSLFTIRFGGETWHQFAPLAGNRLHPAFFALSCHTDELGGDLSPALRAQVLADAANIPALTELLPQSVLDLLQAEPLTRRQIPTTTLALDAPPGSLHALMCRSVRCGSGLVRGLLGRRRDAQGYLAAQRRELQVDELSDAPAGSLLPEQLAGQAIHHEDTFALVLADPALARLGAPALLSTLLDGFLENAPSGVSRLMAFRNLLVRPMGLRTSPLGCPVSSLLSNDRRCLFDQRFPVLAQQIAPDLQHAQVVLGADDKHLQFRSCVGVDVLDGGEVRFTLGTRVHCKNGFGRFYMAVIDRVHRGYITPTMLRQAVRHLLAVRAPATAELPEWDVVQPQMQH